MRHRSANACGANGVCSALGGGAHCAQRACVDAGGARRGGDVCTPGGDLARCDAAGTFTDVRPCAAGEACVEALGAARCAVGPRGMDDDDLPGMMGAPDAGTPTDAGGGVDGGSARVDAGAPADVAGREDAGSPRVEAGAPGADGGADESGGLVGRGCDCRAAPTGAPTRAAWLMLTPLAWVVRRRRRRSAPNEAVQLPPKEPELH